MFQYFNTDAAIFQQVSSFFITAYLPGQSVRLTFL